MISLLEGLPDDVVGFKAEGAVTADEFESTLVPAVRAARDRYGTLHLLCVLGDDFEGVAGTEDREAIRAGLTHRRSWERTAVVGDAEWVRRLGRGFGWMIPGELRFFDSGELEAAKKWVGENARAVQPASVPAKAATASWGRLSRGGNRSSVSPLFARPGEEEVSRSKLNDHEMLAETAYQIVHDESLLDGNARMNLATFVSTWMEPQAARLYSEAFDKNMIDKDEYPQTAAIEDRCVRVLADLWNAPDPETTVGVSTTGSSEACMLAGLAFKRRWQHAREAAGKPTDRPNLVMSSAVQVVWEKFANYWDVEPRYVPITPDEMTLTPRGMSEAIDENTIGVVGLLGVTFTGVYEPIKDLAAALDDLQSRTGLDVPLHVDGASGAMIAPFLQPELEWDFALERVHSINTSGHKYGLVYPGLGWVVWRGRELVPDDLVFHVDYLGGDLPTLALNFSRPGAQVLLQYYNFLRLGREGYFRVQRATQDAAMHLASKVDALDHFELFSDGSDIPVFAWTLSASVDKWDLFDLSRSMRERGWLVPAYHLPADMHDTQIMRVVARNGFSTDLAELFYEDLVRQISWLDDLSGPLPREARGDSSSFRH